MNQFVADQRSSINNFGRMNPILKNLRSGFTSLLLPALLVGVSLTSSKCKEKLPVDNLPTDTIKPNQYTNPVFQPVLADPTVIRDPDNKLFYAYGTEDDWADGHGRRIVPVLESPDLIKWTYVGNAFAQKPTWKTDGGIWAPDINRVNGQYYLYYAYSVWGDANPGIGLAIAVNPRGPFIDQGKLFDSDSIGVPNSIDPFYISDGGKNYLFWGSYSNAATQGTYAIELTTDSRQLKPNAPKIKIAAGDFEAVMIHKKENFYYFFGSKGSCCDGANSNYRVMVARSENLTGPYLDKNGNSILERDRGTLLLQGNSKYAGPGHTSDIITDSKGQDWILYHAIDKNIGKLPNGTSRRVLMLDPVDWDNGWPVIKGGTPSMKAIDKPVF